MLRQMISFDKALDKKTVKQYWNNWTKEVVGLPIYIYIYIYKLMYKIYCYYKPIEPHYNLFSTHTLSLSKKNGLLWWVFCNDVKNCRYMSHTAVLFWIATIHEIFCNVPLDCCNRYSLLRYSTAAVKKTATIL